jgi:hypothetical protein
LADDHVFIRLAAFETIVPEIEKIYGFYRLHPSDYLKTRDPQVIIKGLKRGYGFKIENDQNEPRGVAFMFDRGGRDVEFGGTRVILNGFGLQKLLLQCRLAMAWSYGLFDSHCFSIVKVDNAPSTRSLTTFGMDLRNDLFGHFKSYGIEDPVASQKHIFALSRAELKPDAGLLKTLRQSLLETYERGYLLAKDGRKLYVTFDFELMRNDILRNGLCLA